MKHVVSLILVALIVLAVFCFPTVGGYAIGAVGSVLLVAGFSGILTKPINLTQLIIKESVKSLKGTGWGSGLYQLFRAILVVLLVYGIAVLPGFYFAKSIFVAGYLALQVAGGRMRFYKDSLIRRAYTLKI